MDYDALFEAVRRHLERQGVDCAYHPGKPVTPRALAKAESRMKINLPADLRQFYQTIGNGLYFHWNADQDNGDSPFGMLEFPILSELASEYASWREGVLYTPEQAEKFGFHGTRDPALAKRTAARMWHWLPILSEGNGDQICLDLSEPECPVVFDQHDWFDGGSGTNGHIMASNWREFLMAWAGVCFQFPKSLYWPECFRAESGINWESEQFRSPYRLA